MIARLVQCLGIILVVLIQLSFLSNLPAPISYISLVAVLVIFFAALGQSAQSWWWAIGGGLLLEILTPPPHGVALLSLFVMVGLLDFLFKHMFAGYSVYSLTLFGIIGTCAFNLINLSYQLIDISTRMDAWRAVATSAFWSYLFIQLLVVLSMLYTLFAVFRFAVNRFKLRPSLGW